MTSQLRSIADDIDRLITLDMNRRGVIKILYEAARARLREPLVQLAAESLAGRVKPLTSRAEDSYRQSPHGRWSSISSLQRPEIPDAKQQRYSS